MTDIAVSPNYLTSSESMADVSETNMLVVTETDKKLPTRAAISGRTGRGRCTAGRCPGLASLVRAQSG